MDENLDETIKAPAEEKKQAPEKPQSKAKNIRGNRNFRLAVILILMLIVGLLFVFWAKARIALAIIFFTLLAALGLEATQNDWDIGKLLETKSFESSKVSRDVSGNVLFDSNGDITTNSTKGKKADEYNCDDFENRQKAQVFFEKVGGTGNDLNRLDGDKDGKACEALPQGN
jgi:hypothetical protein